MTQPTSPRKALLMLSLLVLALHLALLQTLPMHLSSTADSATLAFATRTLAPELPAPAAPPVPLKPQPKRVPKVLPTPPKPPKPAKPAPQPEPEPEPEPEPAPAPASETQSLVTPESQATRLSEPAAVAAPAPSPAASAAPLAALDETPAASDTTASNPNQAPPFNLQGVPGSVKLIYQVESNKFPYSLSAELTWQQDESRYAASLQVGAFGQFRIQTSRGNIGPRGLMPERFADKYRSEVAAHFNWPQHKVTFSANTPDVALQDGAQDRMSILIQLAALVASAPERYTPGSRLTLQTVGPRDADVWLFTVGAAEDLQAPSDPPATVETIKLTRQPRQLYDQQMELWLAPALSYLPARIRLQESNGDFLDQRWFATAAVERP